MALLRSEIARLVLDYLKDEGLDNVHRQFCESSPYLNEEYSALKNGYDINRLHDTQLVDLLRELADIKSTVRDYTNTLPLELSRKVINENSVSKKVKLLLNSHEYRSLKRQRSNGDLIENTNLNDLYDSNLYIPLNKRQCIQNIGEQSPNNPTAINQHLSGLSSIKKNYVPFTESDSEEREQLNVFSETILENTDFQNVLVDNINKILETPSNINVQQHQEQQNQIENAIQNIVQTTEQNPMFEEILMECVHSTEGQWSQNDNKISACQSSTPCKDDENSLSNVPLKQRLRNAKTDKNTKRTNQKKTKVKILSNETYTGNMTNVVDAISETNQAIQTSSINIPISQVYTFDPNSNNLITSSTNVMNQGETIYINVPSILMGSDGVQIPIYFESNDKIDPTIQPTNIVINTENVSNVNAALQPTTSSNLNDDMPKLDETINPVQNETNNDVKEINNVELHQVNTPQISSKINQLKAKSLSTPRRKTSHVRVLNFNAPVMCSHPENGVEISNTKTALNTATTVMGTTVPANIDTIIKSQNCSSDTMVTKKDEIIDREETLDLNNIGNGEIVDTFEDKNETPSSSGITMIDTPKSRKLEQPTHCRILSVNKIQKEAFDTVEDDKKHIDSTTDALDEWNKLKLINKNNWDQHIREISEGEVRPYFRKRKKKKNIKTLESKKLIKEQSKELITNQNDPDKLNEMIEKEIPTAVTAPLSLPPPPPSIRMRHLNRRCSRDKAFSIKLSPKKSRKTQNFKSKIPKIKKTQKIPKQNQKPLLTTSIEKSHEKSAIINENSTAIKCHRNLATLLETPFKENNNCEETTENSIPATPRFALPSIHGTPIVKLSKMNVNKSSFKCPEFPTPNVAITPNIVITPLQCNATGGTSPTSREFTNRPTDYSSGSSYYRPDESDDIDKNLDAIIKAQPIDNLQEIYCNVKHSPSIVPKIEIEDYCDDKNVSKMIDAQQQPSTSKFSHTKAASNFNTVIHTNLELADESPVAVRIANTKLSKTELFNKLESVRMRTINKLKKGPEIIQPKSIGLSGGRRIKSIATASTITLRNSVDKLPIIQKTISKRKMTSPMKRVYVDYSSDKKQKYQNDHLDVKKPSVSIGTQETSENQASTISTTGIKIKIESIDDKITQSTIKNAESISNDDSIISIDEKQHHKSLINLNKKKTDKLLNNSAESLKLNVACRTEQELLLFGDTTMSECSPAKIPSITTITENNDRRPVDLESPSLTVQQNNQSKGTKEFSVRKTSTPQQLTKSLQHQKYDVNNIKNSPVSIVDNGDDDDDDDDYDDEEENLYDCCTLSFMDPDKSNQYYECCSNVNENTISDIPPKSQLKSLTIVKNERIYHINAKNEVILFTSSPASSDSIKKLIKNVPVTNPNVINENLDRVKKPIKVNIKYKNRTIDKMETSGPATVMKRETSKSTPQQQKQQTLIQQGNKDIDIDLVLCKVHPSN